MNERRGMDEPGNSGWQSPRHFQAATDRVPVIDPACRIGDRHARVPLLDGRGQRDPLSLAELRIGPASQVDVLSSPCIIHAENESPFEVEPGDRGDRTPDEEVLEQGRHGAVSVPRAAGMEPEGHHDAAPNLPGEHDGGAIQGGPDRHALPGVHRPSVEILTAAPFAHWPGAAPT